MCYGYIRTSNYLMHANIKMALQFILHVYQNFGQNKYQTASQIATSLTETNTTKETFITHHITCELYCIPMKLQNTSTIHFHIPSKQPGTQTPRRNSLYSYPQLEHEIHLLERKNWSWSYSGWLLRNCHVYNDGEGRKNLGLMGRMIVLSGGGALVNLFAAFYLEGLCNEQCSSTNNVFHSQFSSTCIS